MRSNASDDPRIARFGVFEADLNAGELRKRGSRLRLQDRPFRILEVLLERPGAIVTRQELRERLWSSDTFVDFEHGLNAAINKLREALGDTAASPRYIETLPKRGYRFIADVSGTGVRSSGDARSLLAVLPFRNVSGDPSQDLFIDGLTREMTIRVGRLCTQKVAVIASQSALHVCDGDRRVDRIAGALGADYLLDGDVRRYDGRVRISAQLIDVGKGTFLWAESFDRDARDEFSIQREVAAHVAGALAIELLPDPSAEKPVSCWKDPVARESFLQGRYWLNQRTPDALRRAFVAYETATSREPESAEAWACLAETRVLFVAYGLASPARAFPEACQDVLRAITLDPTVPDGHMILAAVRHRHDRDWAEAASGYERALGLDPSCSVVRHLYAQYLSHVGRHDEAIATIREARRIDPLSLIVRAEEACLLTNAGRFEEAAEAARRTLDLDDRFAVAAHSLFRALHQLGRRREALEAARYAARYSGGTPYIRAGLGVAAAAAGRREEARAQVAALEAACAAMYVSPVQIARVKSALGDSDAALELLERGEREHAVEIAEIAADPEWDPLRRQPRFRELVARLGFPAGARRAV